jgi:23S rRNA pseudouridine2605 synthase
VRTQVGPIRLGDTKPGKMRRLTKDEVGQLYTAAGL